jgi:hypothetical protein
VAITAKSVTIMGASGSSNTIVSSGTSTGLEASGSGGDSCFEFVDSGSTAYSITMRGLELTGCRAVENSSGSNDDCAPADDDDCNDGGGINVAPGSGMTLLTLRDVVIDNNASSDDGGGIYLGDADGDFEDVLVFENSADGGGAGYDNTGGGIRAASADHHTLDIVSSSITDNEAADDPTGGGLSERGFDVTLVDVTLSRNTAVGGAGGFMGDVYAADAATTYNYGPNATVTCLANGGGC